MMHWSLVKGWDGVWSLLAIVNGFFVVEISAAILIYKFW